ncbi:MAG TPA: bifunctional diguanylate cyclase/phosphodiesterase [Xanthomonadales bacterium]|nr:bifunctional diguanylate cyclase/phosphodiesterase [Xanthomonadales bacterium]
MGTAVDREFTELLWQLARREGKPSTRFAAATRAFDAAYNDVERTGAASSRPLLKVVARRQAAFLAQSRAVLRAPSAGRFAPAIAADEQGLRAGVEAMQQPLDALSVVSSRAGVAEAGDQRRTSLRLEELIAAVTLLGIALMSGIAEQLRRLKRSATCSAAATLAALEHAALTDSLTGLGNNRSFYDDFEREIARAKRYGHALVLALIDVDDFKAVNDKGGHSHGDMVLARIGERLRNTRREDRGYRIGGDEFALLLVETGPEAARAALDRLQAEIRESGLGATVSIGYVDLSGKELHEESYELADAALYEAKRLGRNQTACFADISGSASVFSPRKADAVRTMIAQGLVSTAFQPIWDMQSTQPLGFEALARPLPELGLSGPQEAFDIAQRIRQLPELDIVCTQKALETAANLPAGSVLFLNYSPASLANAAFDPQGFVAMARAAGFLPEQIVIELTERNIDEPAAVVKRVTALRALGVRIALDDTGSGHAGLEILSKVRFDFVKIDRLLVVDAMANGEARGVLAGIIAIARESGSYLIAEGIETGEMLDFVNAMHIPSYEQFSGVRGVQGYLLGRPQEGGVDVVSLLEHHAFLAARRLRDPRVNAVSGDTASPRSRRVLTFS